MRRVQLRGGARRQPARRTCCTLSRLSRAPYLRRWALLIALGSSGEFLGKPGQLGEVDVGDQGASLPSLLPEDHVEPAIVGPVCLDRAQGIEATCRPGHAASGEYEERDRVQSPVKDEDRGLAIEE